MSNKGLKVKGSYRKDQGLFQVTEKPRALYTTLKIPNMINKVDKILCSGL